MRTRDRTFPLDPAGDLPLFLQIARGVVDDVRRGELRPGDALPGTRSLARALGVNRNTILAAYRELAAEGWVTTRPAGGTFVANTLPRLPRRPVAAASAAGPGAGLGGAARPGYPLAPALVHDTPPAHPAGVLRMGKGVPDVRLLPLRELARAYRRALALHGRELLALGDPHGHPRLRAALRTMLSAARGIAAPSEAILVTRGSQQGLDLAARALLAPGDVVAVEALSHPPAWEALRLAGARLVPVPVDRDGLDVDALATLAERTRVRAVLVTPHHQFPTTVVMPAERRLRLLDLARRHEIAIVEDDYDHEFHYAGRPLRPLAATDRDGLVIYVGTLSNILAPGLRIGFVVAPPPVIERMTSLRVATDLQGDLVVECAVADLFERGALGRHVRRMRRHYQARRDALAEALRRHLDGVLDFDVPTGGMALWARAAADVDVDAWAARGLAAGVAFRGGRMYAYDGAYQPCIRLGFTWHDERELAEAARRMAAALDRAVNSRPTVSASVTLLRSPRVSAAPNATACVPPAREEIRIRSGEVDQAVG